jgi:hypothetical protein
MTQPDKTAESDKAERKGFLRRWYDRYDFVDTWYERINQAQEWIQYLLTLLKTKAASTAAVATVAGGAAVGTVAVVKPELFDELLGRKPVEVREVEVREVEVTATRWGEAAVFPVSGRDAAGAGADFFVIVLPKDYTWARRSSDQIIRNDEALSDEDIAVRVFAAEMREGLAAAPDIMAVGVASQEGVVAVESARAAERAKTAASWLERHSGSQAAIWLLNLGQFRDACAAKDRGDTSWQRPVLFVSVRRKDEGVDLAQALANAIAGKANLPSRECYSNFDLTRFR